VMLAFYREFGNSALYGLTWLGLPVSNEIPLQGSSATKQFFERAVLFYDPQHELDRPPGAGDVYLAHLYSGPGQDPRIPSLQGEVDTLKAELAAEQQKPAAVQQQVDHLTENMKQINLLSQP